MPGCFVVWNHHNKERVIVFEITLKGFNNQEQRLVVQRLRNLAGYRIRSLDLLTSTHWEGRIETAGEESIVFDKLLGIVSEEVGQQFSISSSPGVFVIQRH